MIFFSCVFNDGNKNINFETHPRSWMVVMVTFFFVDCALNRISIRRHGVNIWFWPVLFTVYKNIYFHIDFWPFFLCTNCLENKNFPPKKSCFPTSLGKLSFLHGFFSLDFSRALVYSTKPMGNLRFPNQLKVIAQISNLQL